MHVPKHFEENRVEVLHKLIRSEPFGALVTVTAAGIEANHIPFVLHASPPPLGTLRGHVARTNPVWRALEPQSQILVLFQGPQAYVSPSWYPSKRESGKVVPTWNYVAVHAHGAVRAVEDPAWLRAHLDALVEEREGSREAPWRVADAPAAFTERLMGGIVGLEIRITRLVGQWKLGQNRSAADRAGAAQGLLGEGTEAAARVAELMQAHGQGAGMTTKAPDRDARHAGDDT